jgi:hypothetical protein
MFTLPKLQNPFKVETNVSGYAMGEVLVQGGRLVCYHYELFHGGDFEIPYLQQGSLCFGTKYQKVETLSDGQGDYHPHRSLATTIFVGPE